ncbi:MAG: formylglycine-generating enzyme family protein [Spirochaetaceae bacterium]|nr:MAG: formylglycine-generating enzyme family protein [Spirochaetaceae bacterium]
MAESCCTPGRDPGQEQIHDAAPETSPFPSPQGKNGHEENLVEIPVTRFVMGADDEVGFPDDAEGPVRDVQLAPFRIDRYTVTNRQFRVFVESTRYRTDAERFGWSYVFRGFVGKATLRRGHAREVPGLPWWYGVTGAYWAKPEGKGSSIDERLDHPVVHVSHTDAAAYCSWAGVRLPTEAEWECAARGGLVGKRFVWGDELTPDGRHMCNIWQGTFPTHNTVDDGYAGTAPVDSFEPNGYGLYNVAGNVWEWCADWWTTRHPKQQPLMNPTGPERGTARAMRGGSYLCHHSYCNRYRVAARSSNTPDSSTGNCGFRVAASL